MTKDSTTTPAGAGKDWFTTYSVFARPQGEPGWLGLEGRDAKKAAKDFDEAGARVAQTGVAERGVYVVSGMREAGDVMVWM
ncbi:chlorite dismutase, partial [Moraxella catarrhalis]|nr:chlorite dismutase [Moraxella catarrhalis]